MDSAPKPRLLLKRVHETAKDLTIAGVVGIILLWFLPSWLRCTIIYAGTILFIANVIVTFVTNLRPKSRLQSSGKAVVISGCDSGFGHMLAQKLDDLGYHVFAGCLFPDGEGAQNLRKSASNRLHVVQMDVTKDEDVQDAVTYVKSKLENNKLWAVVCNAGLNDGGELNWTDMETIKKVLEINAFGVVRVTKAFLPDIMKNQGRVVAVASAAGRYSYMGMVPYCMSKHAVVSFCDGLRLEMYRWGVQVITVEPWMYKTNITQKDLIEPYLKRTWERAPEDIKKSYPNSYLEKYMESTAKFLTISLSDKPHEVVSCLEEAVTAKYPKYSYNPGTVYSRLTFWFIRRLPKPIADFVILHASTVAYGNI